MTGHYPVFELADNDETPRQASPSVFLGYCNVALTQAMSERMARWGRDFVDPKSFWEPQYRNGRSHGIRVVRTDFIPIICYVLAVVSSRSHDALAH